MEDEFNDNIIFEGDFNDDKEKIDKDEDEKNLHDSEKRNYEV